MFCCVLCNWMNGSRKGRNWKCAGLGSLADKLDPGVDTVLRLGYFDPRQRDTLFSFDPVLRERTDGCRGDWLRETRGNVLYEEEAKAKLRDKEAGARELELKVLAARRVLAETDKELAFLTNRKKHASVKSPYKARQTTKSPTNQVNTFIKKPIEEQKETQMIESLSNRLQSKRSEMNKLAIQIEGLQADIDTIRNELSKHYHSLLRKGEDVRGIGLIWIILEIWYLKRNVVLSFFPQFLDIESVKYLMDQAGLKLKYEKLSTEFKNTKLCNRPNQASLEYRDLIGDSNSVLNKGDLIGDTQSRIRHYFSSFKIEELLEKKDRKFTSTKRREVSLDAREGKISFKEISRIIENREKKLRSRHDIINEIGQTEQQLSALSLRIQNLRRFYLDRLFKKFLYHGYSERFQIGLKAVLKALVGEDFEIELNRFKMLKEEYERNCRVIRSFSITGRDGFS